MVLQFSRLCFRCVVSFTCTARCFLKNCHRLPLQLCADTSFKKAGADCVPTSKSDALAWLLSAWTQCLFTEWIFQGFNVYFFSVVSLGVGTMRYNYCTAWRTAHLFAMLNAPREKWLCRCPIRWWLWWLSVKTISGPCLTYDEMKKKKKTLPCHTHSCTALSWRMSACVGLRCYHWSRLSSTFICRASLGLKLLWCRWRLRAEFWGWDCTFMPGLMLPQLPYSAQLLLQ